MLISAEFFSITHIHTQMYKFSNQPEKLWSTCYFHAQVEKERTKKNFHTNMINTVVFLSFTRPIMNLQYFCVCVCQVTRRTCKRKATILTRIWNTLMICFIISISEENASACLHVVDCDMRCRSFILLPNCWQRNESRIPEQIVFEMNIFASISHIHSCDMLSKYVWMIDKCFTNVDCYVITLSPHTVDRRPLSWFSYSWI